MSTQDLSNADITLFHTYLFNYIGKVYPSFPHTVAVKQVAEPEPVADAPAEDDEFDFFGDEDSADEAAAAELKAKLEEEKANKKKAGPVERSAIIMAVKPADVDVDMDELEAFTRAIEMEGLEWKASEMKDVAFGIQKLVISCHIVDELVSMDTIEQILEEKEDLVSSTEILSFSKL
eukprot:TRINITY_DN295_c0_g1_i2.p1 TRINITY_DN295_c0_g1~~TRINITY_DN295_c0_g1_i2.p1  ORF type:complete len:177 (-),score=62.39 TRINITY_DN295_c0_g1_i2:57-587(-)